MSSSGTSDTQVFDLSHRGLIKVHGDDAESFLQNQLSNDIKNVNESTHQISAWCTPKGRIIATFRIFKRDNAYYLSLSDDLVEHVLKKLGMYVMMSKVTLEDASDSIKHYGVVGDTAINTLSSALGTDAPNDANQSVTANDVTVLNLSASRLEVFVDVNNASQLTELLGTTEADDAQWDYLDIQAGLPMISNASSEAWIPQMVNFIEVGGVDFKKGCYPGQEVVARLNYLGKTKRRMYRLLINTDTLPAINDAVASADDQDAGKILSAAINPEGKVEALAVLKIAEAEKALTLASNTISLLELPYSIKDA